MECVKLYQRTSTCMRLGSSGLRRLATAACCASLGSRSGAFITEDFLLKSRRPSDTTTESKDAARLVLT